jgi:hypothetical protein
MDVIAAATARARADTQSSTVITTSATPATTTAAVMGSVSEPGIVIAR